MRIISRTLPIFSYKTIFSIHLSPVIIIIIITTHCRARARRNRIINDNIYDVFFSCLSVVFDTFRQTLFNRKNCKTSTITPSTKNNVCLIDSHSSISVHNNIHRSLSSNIYIHIVVLIFDFYSVVYFQNGV